MTSLESLSKDSVLSGLEINFMHMSMHHEITLSLISLWLTFQKSKTWAITSSKGSGLIHMFKNFKRAHCLCKKTVVMHALQRISENSLLNLFSLSTK